MNETIQKTNAKESNKAINPKENYTIIDKRTLADSLNFLGFRYYKYNKEGREIYTFENTDKFKLALHKLLELRKILNNI